MSRAVQPAAVSASAADPSSGRSTGMGVQSGHVLVVDWERCVGHGVCAAAFEERIDLDDWGYPLGVTTRGVGIPEDLLRAARVAVRSCPAAALRLTRAGRG